MLQKRIIPILQIQEGSIVKTTKFKNPKYIGDVINTIRIFNEFEVDELVLIDIKCSRERSGININLLKNVTNECFMPLAYGGGITSIEEAKEIISIGFEKLILNTTICDNPEIIKGIVNEIGSQSVVAAIDISKNIFGKYQLKKNGNKRKHNFTLENWINTLEKLKVGEILITSIEREGTWQGLNIELLSKIANKVNIPIILNGGANSILDIKNAFENGASAVGVSSLVIYQKKDMGVLINYENLNY